MESIFSSVKGFFDEWGYIAVALLLFGENIPFVGLFTPAITLMLFLGFSYFMDLNHLALLVLIAWCAMLVSDTIWYVLGRISGAKWPALAPLNRRVPNIIRRIRDMNVGFLFFYQFPPYFRMFFPFAMGVYGMPIARWAVLSITASFMYVFTFVAGGAVVGRFFSDTLGPEDAAFLATICMTTFLFVYPLIIYFGIRYDKRR